MISIRYDSEGNVSGMPGAIRPGDDLSFELIGKDVSLVQGDDLRLALAFDSPSAVFAGDWTISYGGDSSEPLPCQSTNSYLVQLALNQMPSIISAGGVLVSGFGSSLIISFLDVGTRTAITLSHSILGPIASRSAVVTAGGVSTKHLASLDLSVQVIAESVVGTDIVGAAVAVTEIDEGDATASQRDEIEFSRMPDGGKFQIWIAEDAATRWLHPSVSAYQVQCALDDIDDGAYIVSRRTVGETVIFDLMRSEIGAADSVSVSDTFMGPTGVTMDLDGGKILDFCAAAKLGYPSDAVLTFIRNDQTQFSHPVRLSPVLLAHGQVL